MTSNLPAQYQPAAPAPRPGGALSLAHMTPADAWRFAEALAGSGMLPKQYQGKPASVLWALEYGRAIGLDVITTTQSVHVIQGRATASADLMASLTRRAGHRMRISGDDQRAEVVIIRADDPEFEFRVEWTVQRAQRAKLLGKDTWQQYPAAMLRARAISECVRMACPEVLHGSIYTPEEIGARVDAEGLPVEAQVHELRRVQPGETDQWATPAPEPQTAAQGRDYLHEARQALDAATVRRIWREAGADGAAPEYLAQIAAVGKDKASAERRRHPTDAELRAALDSGHPEVEASAAEELIRRGQMPISGQQAEPVDAEIVPDGEDAEHAQAVAELLAAAQAAGVPDIEAEFESSFGLPIAQARVPQLREMQRILAGSAA